MHTPRLFWNCRDNERQQQEEEELRQKGQITSEEAIRVQRELKLYGCDPIAVERGCRMFAIQYGSPLLMLRQVKEIDTSLYSRCGRDQLQQQNLRMRKTYSLLSSLSVPYCRAEPCIYRRTTRDSSQPLFARQMRIPPFPSIAARLENDVALGLAASLWDSGNVVGHCDDRLAHLLVLSITVVQCARRATHTTGKPCVPLKLREAFMDVIEHLVRLECVVANGMCLTLDEENQKAAEEARKEHVESSMEFSWGTDVFTLAVGSTVRVLKGLVEPSTLGTATVAPVWQYSLVRTAADVPSRYDILDAMAYVLQPCDHLKVRRTFCAVARQLALEVMHSAGDNKIGLRGAAAAVSILQHINTRPVFLTMEEREAGQCLLTLLQQKIRRVTALLPPDIADDGTEPMRKLVDTVRLFCAHSA